LNGDFQATQRLARYVVESDPEDVPHDVRHEAARSLVNWLACGLGGSRHEAIQRAVAALRPFAGPPQATLIGRRDRFDVLHAALLNGMSAHVLDFDDTHLRTLVHPSVPVASSLLALSERQSISGCDFIHAFVLGVEVECRIANAIYASHNVSGYITGTAGVFGAAAAASRVLGLSAQHMTWALGIAATQAAGLREMAGTMSKSFVHGRAAQNGLVAALLAQKGFTSSERSIEAPRGFARVLAGVSELEALTAGLGERFELSLNTYKPYACGVVCHPVIDACIALGKQLACDPTEIEFISLRVHPLALKLTGIKKPSSGLESKWSIYHSSAVALVDRVAGEHQYSDERLNDPCVSALRDKVTAEADTALADDAAHVTIALRSGRTLEHYVEHATGSVARPMSDAALEQKFLTLADGVLARSQLTALLETCWQVERLDDVSSLARLSTPAEI
jgi:2-methylcitrate dehydratase PrpD